MRPYKVKIEETVIDQPVEIRGYSGMSYTIQSIFYSSENPSAHLTMSDKDGDTIYFPMPGQMDPKPITVENVTVRFPITLIDDEGGNTVIIRGVVAKNRP